MSYSFRCMHSAPKAFVSQTLGADLWGRPTWSQALLYLQSVSDRISESQMSSSPTCLSSLSDLIFPTALGRDSAL